VRHPDPIAIGFISGSVLVFLLIYWRKELMILAVREDTNHGGRSIVPAFQKKQKTV